MNYLFIYLFYLKTKPLLTKFLVHSQEEKTPSQMTTFHQNRKTTT